MWNNFNSKGVFGGHYLAQIIVTPHNSSYELTIRNKIIKDNYVRFIISRQFSSMGPKAITNLIDEINKKIRIRSLEIDKNGQLETLRAVLQSVYPRW